ncbi:MAG: class I SAM-dependent methyltransferase [Ignavibacteria bacterium]|jgi:SAM-dependent methyltransferase|nr:class I SAM-dependent methyltransferase [Ignavibacteria bacterium]MCU7503344.1 class I SAM-dependent methyltransferase [Ignavibacteria bacterium]MCU7515710.1 class I SAM-dependent methyltransferase [Ignavibacteria bacterium]
MHYDPIKNIFAGWIKKFPFLRVWFYKLLDLMFLRSWYVRGELRKLRQKLGSRSLNIYDAGTGYGQYAYFMARNLEPNNIYAVDVKEEWIEDCRSFFSSRKMNNVTFGVEDLTQIGHKERFDLILSVDVMEHIVEDVKVFENFYGALKPGGFLMINTPSVYGGSDVHEEEEESFIGEHARTGYSSEELKGKLEPLGFETYQSKYTYGNWGDRSWRLGIKYPMQMLNASKLFLVILPIYYILTFPFTLLMMYLDYRADNKLGAGINFIARKPEQK